MLGALDVLVSYVLVSKVGFSNVGFWYSDSNSITFGDAPLAEDPFEEAPSTEDSHDSDSHDSDSRDSESRDSESRDSTLFFDPIRLLERCLVIAKFATDVCSYYTVWNLGVTRVIFGSARSDTGGSSRIGLFPFRMRIL